MGCFDAATISTTAPWGCLLGCLWDVATWDCWWGEVCLAGAATALIIVGQAIVRADTPVVPEDLCGRTGVHVWQAGL